MITQFYEKISVNVYNSIGNVYSLGKGNGAHKLIN